MTDHPHPNHHERHEARIEHEGEELEVVEERLASLAGRAGISSLMQNEAISAADLLQVLGGARGLAETLLPGIVFVVAFALTSNSDQAGVSQTALQLSLALSLGLAVVFVGLRLLQRSQTRAAVAGLLAVSASAAVALLTGNPSDNYLLSLIINAVYGTAMLLSVLVGWPLLGLFMGFLMGDGVQWRKNPKRYRVMLLLTLIWAAMFAARLAVELPLYLAGNTVALGVVRLLMGTPLYALLLVVTWLITRAVYPSTHASSTE